MARFVYDKDLDCLVEIGEFSNREPPRSRKSNHGVISDIEPYRTVAADVAAGDKCVTIGSRSEHRAFLRRNGYVEVGNDPSISRPRAQVRLSRADRARAIQRAIHQLQGRGD